MVRFSASPDLCDHREEAEILLNRLKGADLDAAFLPYVVEDYLGELYGLHFFLKILAFAKENMLY